MELSQYGELFVSESREHLAAINHLLLTLERAPASADAVEGVFRAVHTIKGMSATMGFGGIAALAHEMEEVLASVRRGARQVDASLADLLFEGADALERAVELAVDGNESPPAPEPLLRRLRAAAERQGDESVPAPPAAERAHPADPDAFAVELWISRESPFPGVRAVLALRRARELGQVRGVEPAEADLATEAFGGVLRFSLRSTEDADAVRKALLAVGEMERVQVVEPQPSLPGPSGGALGRNVRVDVRRLDALMNGVGELVIVRDRLQRLASGGDGEFAEALEHAGRLIAELQEEVVQARLVPVRQVFDRFPRLVRDAARGLGKRVQLLVEGSEIELDRSVLDEIGDPLVHLLRNSVDHGIETPAERRAAGKPETGTIRLSAARERSRMVVRVQDDGRGIDGERVRARAAEAGRIDPGQSLAEEEVLRLILEPGFSTAQAVTDVSGRGVGLDVVATRVRALGGALEVASQPSRGTVFTLRLPLSLAIFPALLIEAAGQRYALPLTHVEETVEIGRAALRTLRGRNVALLRGDVIPLLDLRTALGEAPSPAAERQMVVVLETGDQIAALAVDEVLGQREMVVKPFDATVCTRTLFSGASILADGRPVLILDVGSLLQHSAPTVTA